MPQAHSLAPLVVMLPLIMAAVLAIGSHWLPRRVTEILAIGTAVVVVACCIGLVSDASGTRLIYWFGGWTPRHGAAIGVGFVIDELGAGIATLVALLVTASLVFSIRYFDTVGSLFQILMLTFLAGMAGFALTGDLFNMFVFFEVMGVSAYALTAYKIEETGPLQGALNFAITNSVGAFLMLTGIALLYGRTGALNMAQIGAALRGRPVDSLVVAAFVLVLVGLLVKGSIVPFHWWLPDAHAVAPTPVCVLFSGIMVELGLYGVLRIYWDLFSPALGGHADAIRAVLVGLGVLTAIVGGLMCVLQQHLKRLLAFSTISNAGIVLIGAALLSPLALAGMAVFIVGHGLVKGALFLESGILLHRHGSIEENELYGRGRDMPWTGTLFLAGGLAIAGLPPFAVYAGKGIIERAAASAHYDWLLAVLLIASMLSGGGVLRAGARIFLGWGERPRQSPVREEAAKKEQPETKQASSQTPAVMLVPCLVLTLLAIAAGLTPGFWHEAGRAAAQTVDASGYIAQVLGLPELHPAHLRVPVSVTVSVSDIVTGLIGTALAVMVAAVGVFGNRVLGGPYRTVLAGTHPSRALLESLQSGLMTDYVVWIVAGTAGLGAVLTVLLK